MNTVSFSYFLKIIKTSCWNPVAVWNYYSKLIGKGYSGIGIELAGKSLPLFAHRQTNSKTCIFHSLLELDLSKFH